ncbi:unnamed protein product, partial [Owenia fusiformis]
FVSTTLGIFTGHRHFSTNKTYDDLAHILKPTTPSTARHYQALLYDNMWAIALAINTTIQKYGIDEVKNYKHNSNENKTLLESLYKNLLEEEFDGVSGLYYYNKTSGVRQTDSYVGILDANATLSNIGFFNKRERNLTMTEPADVIWKSKGGITPTDSEIEHVVRRRISKIAIIVLSAFAGLGI